MIDPQKGIVQDKDLCWFRCCSCCIRMTYTHTHTNTAEQCIDAVGTCQINKDWDLVRFRITNERKRWKNSSLSCSKTFGVLAVARSTFSSLALCSAYWIFYQEGRNTFFGSRDDFDFSTLTSESSDGTGSGSMLYHICLLGLALSAIGPWLSAQIHRQWPGSLCCQGLEIHSDDIPQILRGKQTFCHSVDGFSVLVWSVWHCCWRILDYLGHLKISEEKIQEYLSEITMLGGKAALLHQSSQQVLFTGQGQERYIDQYIDINIMYNTNIYTLINIKMIKHDWFFLNIGLSQ